MTDNTTNKEETTMENPLESIDDFIFSLCEKAISEQMAKKLVTLTSVLLKLADAEQTGLLDNYDSALSWVNSNNYWLEQREDAEPLANGGILLKATKQAFSSGLNIIDVLDFVSIKAAKRPRTDRTTAEIFWDMLRRYAAGEENITARAIKAQKGFQRAQNTKEKGIATAFPSHLISYPGKDFIDAFTAKMISALSPDAKPVQAPDGYTIIPTSIKEGQLLPITEIQTPIMYAISTLVHSSYVMGHFDGNTSVRIYLPGFFSSCHIDPRSMFDDRSNKKNGYKQNKRTVAINEDTGQPLTIQEMRYKAIQKMLKPLYGWIAKTRNQSMYRVCTLEEYDATTETLKISVPFFFRVYQDALDSTDEHGIKGAIAFFHASIANEKNTAAVELANRILSGIIRRGVTNSDAQIREQSRRNSKEKNGGKSKGKAAPSPQGGYDEILPKPTKKKKTFTTHFLFKSLIIDCPQIVAALDEIKARPNVDENGKRYAKSQAINAKLQQIFTAAYRIILQKSDAPQYYKNLKFRPELNGRIITPTNSTLNDKLYITHQGKNPDFVPYD